MKISAKEKKIILSAVIGTAIVTLGFTLSQQAGGSGDTYVSVENNISKNKYEVSSEDYEIINKKNEDKKIIYNIYCKREFNSKELAYLTKKLKEDNKEMKDNYQIYLFTDQDKAKNYEGSIEGTEKTIIPIENSRIKISDYKNIEQQVESIPSKFDILSVKEVKGSTEVELILDEQVKSEEALAQMKFLGDYIKKENRNKNIGILKMIAYTSEKKDKAWEYDGNYKSFILNNQYENLD